MKKVLLSTFASVALSGYASAATLFSSEFDSGADFSSEVSGADQLITFGYDYSADGLSSPDGTDTIGLKMEANLMDGVATGVAVYTNQGFTGNYQVSFDFYISNSTSGTTEFIGGGAGFSTGNGFLGGAVLIGDSDGDSGSDFRFYDNGNLGATYNNTDPLPTSAFPGAGGNAPGTLAFAWHKMVIDVNGASANFTIDGVDFGSTTGVNDNGSVSLVYADLFTSVSNMPERSFGIIDNLTVTDVIPEPSSSLLLGLSFLGLALRRRR
ncbi:MAG: PEP-CTERM sorting domain-containing protein [Verrucomicrobiota bacterium]